MNCWGFLSSLLLLLTVLLVIGVLAFAMLSGGSATTPAERITQRKLEAFREANQASRNFIDDVRKLWEEK